MSLWNQFKYAKKKENRKPKIRWRDGIRPTRWGWDVLTRPFRNWYNSWQKEQSLSENQLARLIAGESAAKVSKYENNQAKLVELLKLYSNNNILKQLEGLSFNFDFFSFFAL